MTKDPMGRTELGDYCERCGVVFGELETNTQRAYAGDLRAWEAFAEQLLDAPAWPATPMAARPRPSGLAWRAAAARRADGTHYQRA